jgi:hypothetical protein
MKKINKFLATSVFSVGIVAGIYPSAMAVNSDVASVASNVADTTINSDYLNNYTNMTQSDFTVRKIVSGDKDIRYIVAKTPLVSLSGTDELMLSRYPLLRTTMINNQRPDIFFARRVVLLDIDNPNMSVVIRNQNTGPFAVNTAVVTVDDTFFNNFVSNLDIDSNLNLAIDTANNTISMNTVAGDVVSGSATVNLQ